MSNLPIPIGTVRTVLAVRRLLEAAALDHRCGDLGGAETLEVDVVLALRASPREAGGRA
jgi:hypothetical protein